MRVEKRREDTLIFDDRDELNVLYRALEVYQMYGMPQDIAVEALMRCIDHMRDTWDS